MDSNAPDATPCGFSKAWQGQCRRPSDNGYCSEHDQLVCVVSGCNEQATHSCDATPGPFVCGVALCENHTHTPFGDGHVSLDEAAEILQKLREEEHARIRSREDPCPRMNEELGVPLNLFELEKVDAEAEGFRLADIFYAELEHHLMGSFPAIMWGDRRPVITTDLDLLAGVWKLLPARESRIRVQRGYVHDEKRLVYPNADVTDQFFKEEQTPVKLFTREELEELRAADHETSAFGWAPGLISLRGKMSRTEFEQMIDRAVAEAKAPASA